MTAHSPDTRRGGDKRERILASAEQVFAERGFFAARVAEIARGAGVADGTIYLYFKSKDDLLISLFESRMERVNRDLTDATEHLDDPSEKLRAFIGAYCTMVRENPQIAEILTVELRQSSKFMKEYSNPKFADLLKLLAGIIANGQATGAFVDSVPAPIAARMIFGLIDELALTWLLGGGEKFDIVRAADWVGAITMRGLEPRSES